MEGNLVVQLSAFTTPVLILIAIIMFFILSKGADLLINEAVGLSYQWGIPKVIIGATIVSLGTTLPEVSVSVLAALNGNPDLALGNGIGSIIVDTGLIIGIASFFGVLPISDEIITRQGRIQLATGLLLIFISLPFFTSNPGGHISQPMGFFFLILLVLYLFFSIRWSKNSFSPVEVGNYQKVPSFIRLLKMLIGIFLIIGSSKLLIHSVEISAIRAGIPQSIIAATLVAFGTSLPELIMAISSVRKGHGELAIGNIVGADILNVLFVIGGAAAVTNKGLTVPINYFKLQFPVLFIILFLFRIFSVGEKRQITRKKGLILISVYFIYLIANMGMMLPLSF